MINEVYTIEKIINECTGWLKNNNVAKNIGLLEINKHIQNIVNKYDYKFLRRDFFLTTETDKLIYRLPDWARDIIGDLDIQGDNTIMQQIDEDYANSLKAGGLLSLTGYPYFLWLGKYTCLQEDITTKGDLLRLESTSFTAGTVTISGLNEGEEVDEEIDLTGGGTTVDSTQGFTVIESVSIDTVQANDLVIKEKTSGATKITISAGDTSSDTETKITTVGSQITFVSDNENDTQQIYIEGTLENELQSEVVVLNGTTDVDTTNNYSDITQVYKFSNTKGTVTAIEKESSTLLLTLKAGEKKYLTKKIHIEPCDKVFTIKMVVLKNLPVYDDAKYVIDIPTRYVPGVIIYGILVNMLLLDGRNQNLIQKLQSDYKDSLRALKTENLERNVDYPIIPGFETLTYSEADITECYSSTNVDSSWR